VSDLPLQPDSVSIALTPNAVNPIRIVSVSLGSSSRNHTSQAHFLGKDWILERVGTDGDLQKARKLIEELDGHVGAFGLGGIDLYLFAGTKRYILRDAQKLANAAKKTPVVDGSGLKHTLERSTIQKLQNEGLLPLKGKKVGVTCAVDRFGMSQELVKVGADVSFGDLLFILNIPIQLRNLQAIQRAAALILPFACRLPFKVLYPTGEKQKKILDSKNHRRFFEENEIIAGDFLLIRRYLPQNLAGKTILTNTVTPDDIELLRERNCARLITTTPEFEGRSFGTNVMEGIFAALGDKTPKDYEARLAKLNWQPRVINF
jgi:hypothetical protein